MGYNAIKLSPYGLFWLVRAYMLFLIRDVLYIFKPTLNNKPKQEPTYHE